MGTPAFAVPSLRALASAAYEVVGVYTQPDRRAGRGRRVVPSPAKQASMELGIGVYQPKSFREANAVDQLKALKPEVIVVAAYGLILPRAVLEVPAYGTLNVHPSLLPRHRGASPVASAILSGDEDTGVTIMLVEPRVDAGPVLSSTNISIGLDDTTGTLTEKLARVGADLLVETLPRWLRGEIEPEPQDDSKATYSKMITKADGEIDWRMPAEEIGRRVRAFDPWPGTYTRWRGKLLKVLRGRPREADQAVEPGAVVPLSGAVAVATGEGALVLDMLQLEGRKVMDAETFVRGHRGFVGSTLPS
ncbi:MAG: methionyl-tRNA formyltransferase [Dehalococcoidia bacterium]